MAKRDEHDVGQVARLPIEKITKDVICEFHREQLDVHLQAQVPVWGASETHALNFGFSTSRQRWPQWAAAYMFKFPQAESVLLTRLNPGLTRTVLALPPASKTFVFSVMCCFHQKNSNDVVNSVLQHMGNLTCREISDPLRQVWKEFSGTVVCVAVSVGTGSGVCIEVMTRIRQMLREVCP